MSEPLFPHEAQHPWTPPASVVETSSIGGRQPDHRRQWDVQCARCGSSIERVLCEGCNGEGYVDDEDDLDGFGGAAACSSCCGEGGWWRCLSDDRSSWCRKNPLPGRADVAPSTVEWFVARGPTR